MDFKAKLRLLSKPAPGPSRNPSAPEIVSDDHLSNLIKPTLSQHGPLYLKREIVVDPRLSIPPCPDAIATLALRREFKAIDPSRLLYLDTETTGLAGGTGTLAFLIGLAHVDGENIVVEQTLLPRPGEERSMLEWLRVNLTRAQAIVTFNGKSFDWPLLKSRFVMNRLPAPPELVHVDLLHLARRVYRWHLKEHRLSSLEVGVLKIERSHDIDGAMIPQAWFDYLRTGRLAELARAIDHNRQDVVSMVRLLQVLTQSLRHEIDVAPAISLGLALVAERFGDDALAIDHVRKHTAMPDGALMSRALELEAMILRRSGENQRAIALFERALLHSSNTPRIHLALARLYEHREKNEIAALHHALLSRHAEPEQDHSKRVTRIRARSGARRSQGQLSLENAAMQQTSTK